MIKGIGALFGVLLLMLLQACEGPRPARVGADQTDDKIQASQPPADAPAPTPAPALSQHPVTAPPPPIFSQADRDPKRLLKMRLGGVSTLLGKPQFIRREASARVWQYRTNTCVLDLFMYDIGAEYEVVYYEFRPAAVLSGSTQGCFEKFLTRAANTAKS